MDTESAAKAEWNRARVELPDAEPGAKATLPRTRLEEMLARRQLTDSEYALAIMFQSNPCGRAVLKGYYAIVVGIVLHDKPAEALADPRSGRSKGIDEVMRKLRIGLRLMTDHYYLPDDDGNETLEGYGTPKWRTLQAKQIWSADMHRASMIKQAWRSMPKARRRMLFAGEGANDVPRPRLKAHPKEGNSLKF